ncbi:MAG: hypothetical protein R3C49_24965 [Planctomycetaceae bacterium]
MSPRPAVLLPILVTIACLTTAGCGGDTPPIGFVSGTIKLNGQPLEGANVEFTPANGRGSVAVTDAEGKYILKYTNTVDGALVGQHTVRISTGVAGSASNEGGDSPAGKPERIPPAYNSQSEVKADVKSGSNTFDYDIDSGGQTFPLIEGGSKARVNDA